MISPASIPPLMASMTRTVTFVWTRASRTAHSAVTRSTTPWTITLATSLFSSRLNALTTVASAGIAGKIVASASSVRMRTPENYRRG
jgi:hypothetical protein